MDQPRRKRIAIIADTYPPLRISGAVQMRDLVREFADQGHEPTVVVPAAGLDRPWKLEHADGITTLRVRTSPTKDVSYVRRAINEMRLPYMLLKAMDESGIRHVRWDGIVWYAPTIFLGPIVRRLRRDSGCRSYLILRDIFPEWAVDMGLMRRGPAYWFFKWVEARQYAVADTIGVQTEANLPYMKRWAQKAGRSLEVLQNWLSPAPRAGCRIDISRTRLAGRRIFVYTGNMGVAQGMDVFLDLVARMRDRKDVGFLFVGRGSDAARFAATAERERLDNVLFYDEIEPNEIPGLLAQCDFGMLALDPRHKSHNIPGKFLTYMQAGLPVLARINPRNDLEKLIQSEGVGRVCTGGDAAVLQRLAEELLADPSMASVARERGRRLWEREFSTGTAVRQIVRGLESTAPVPAAEEEEGRLSVLFLNQFFYPDISATAQHAFDLAKFLRARGDKVSAIASRSIYGRTGSALPAEEIVDGIEIHRVTSSVFGKRGIASRSYDFFAFNVACLFKAITLPRHDVVVCLTTPPFIALVGMVLRWMKGTRFVFWTMDLYPDVPLAAGVIKRGSFAHWIFSKLDRFCLRRADLVVVLGRCMRDRVLANGVSPRRLATITPWSDPDEVQNIPSRRFAPSFDAVSAGRAAAVDMKPVIAGANNFREEWGIGNRFVIEYSGNCGVGHDVASVCEAMLALRDDDDIRWVIVGGGVAWPKIEEFIARHRIQNVVLKPYQPRSRLGELIALGDVHLVLVADGFDGLLIPSKFYGVMAAGRPTIYVGPESTEVAQVIQEEQCGYVIPNGNTGKLVGAIRRLQRDPVLALTMGLRGRRALEEQYAMQIACAKWHERTHTLAGIGAP
jgi:glycosyltransferase involved in cell wall biosynthesis